MKAILVFLASLISVYCVGCANGCSGHGTCSMERECLCFRQQGLGLNDGDFEDFGWTGADCSIRMCPQGLSFAPQSLKNAIPWFNTGTEIYKASYTVGTEAFTSALDERLHKGITINADLSEVMQAGGRAVCYDGSMNFLANFDIYQGITGTDTQVINEVVVTEKTTELYGIPTTFSVGISDPDNIDKMLEGIRYCRIPYIRKDLSLFTFFTLKQTEKELNGTEKTWRRTLKGHAIEDMKTLFGSSTDNIDVNIACRNSKTVDTKSQYVTVHPVKVRNSVDAIKNSENDEIIIEIDKSEKIDGSCSFLYSPITGSSISLRESELYNLIGTENYFGYQIEDGVLLWAEPNNETTDYSVTQSEFNLTTKTFTNADFTDITYDRPTKSEGEIRQIMQNGKEVAIISFGVSNKINISSFNPENDKIYCEYNTEISFVTLKEVERLGDNLDNGRVEYRIKVTPEPYINRNITSVGVTEQYFLPVGILISNVGPHMYAECSGAGSCNRETGKCECYEGYYGSACQRVKCPNDCNQRGKCLTAREYFEQTGDTYYGDSILPVCKCDGGYRGIDCSQIECPSSEDPNQATNLKDKGNESEHRDCSGRGVCDYSNGKCDCFKGYAGDACNILLSTY